MKAFRFVFIVLASARVWYSTISIKAKLYQVYS